MSQIKKAQCAPNTENPASSTSVLLKPGSVSVQIKKLKTKKGRDESGLFVVEGEKFVAEIPAHFEISRYLVTQEFAETHDLAPYEARARVEIIRTSVFAAIADTVTSQGVLAVCAKVRPSHSGYRGSSSECDHTFEDGWESLSDLELMLGDGVAGRMPAASSAVAADGGMSLALPCVGAGARPARFYLLGENINDPGNMGTLVRTAAAAGASGAIFTRGSCDVFSPKVIRAAAGASLRLPLVADACISETLAVLKSCGIPVFAAHPRGDVLPYELDMRENFCLLIGNESAGISETAKKSASALVRLPMPGETESLNASVAGSILLYEAVRQRI